MRPYELYIAIKIWAAVATLKRRAGSDSISDITEASRSSLFGPAGRLLMQNATSMSNSLLTPVWTSLGTYWLSVGGICNGFVSTGVLSVEVLSAGLLAEDFANLR